MLQFWIYFVTGNLNYLFKKYRPPKAYKCGPKKLNPFLFTLFCIVRNTWWSCIIYVGSYRSIVMFRVWGKNETSVHVYFWVRKKHYLSMYRACAKIDFYPWRLLYGQRRLYVDASCVGKNWGFCPRRFLRRQKEAFCWCTYCIGKNSFVPTFFTFVVYIYIYLVIYLCSTTRVNILKFETSPQ